MESWICNSSYSFDDKNFRKIYDFYVLKTPAKNVSYRGVSLKERGFNRNTVINQIKKISPDLNTNMIGLGNDENILESLKMNDISNHFKDTFKSTPFEYAIYKYKKSSFKKTERFFYYIRCALAHGAFCIHTHDNEKYYCFENIHNNSKKMILNARMVLKEKTLLDIIEFCDSKMNTN